MGCVSSAQRHERQEREAEAQEQNGDAGSPSDQQNRNSSILTRLGTNTARLSPRQNNVVPMPEGLFTGNANGEPGVTQASVARPPHNPPPKVHNTKTVRAWVNLKKHTLRIFPDEENEGKFRIKFVADSLVPCRGMIYIMAYEKDQAKVDAPPRLKSKHSKREPSAVVNLSGLEQSYCTPSGQGLPLGNFEEEQLTVKTCSASQVYPVVIRLQAVQASGDKANPVNTVQAQTTFASLVKQADGSYDIQVLKQVLWVNGTSYVLHEIFGIDKSSEEEGSGLGDGSKDCVICLAETRNTLALPCRHLCLCSDCAKALRYQSNKCPICRTVVQSLLQIKLGSTQPGEGPPSGQLLLDRPELGTAASGEEGRELAGAKQEDDGQEDSEGPDNKTDPPHGEAN